MIYSIYKLPEEPIFLVRILAPMHAEKCIYAIDTEILRLIDPCSGRKIYRIDDFTRLRPHQFTLSDAVTWFTGPIREDQVWRGQIEHVGACNTPISQMIGTLHRRGEKVYMPLFTSVEEAIGFTRLEIARHAGQI